MFRSAAFTECDLNLMAFIVSLTEFFPGSVCTLCATMPPNSLS